MTRIVLSELKNAGRDAALRKAPPGAQASFSTPMPTAKSAVRRFHREGATAATVQLNATFDRSTHWGPGGPSSAVGWANAIRTCLETYIDMASGDQRPTLGAPITTDVHIGSNSVGVSVDVVLIDDAGYVARHPLWDVPALTQDDAERLAAPIAMALQHELGADRVVGVEIWHLRSGTAVFVDTPTAIGRIAEVAAIIDRYVD